MSNKSILDDLVGIYIFYKLLPIIAIIAIPFIIIGFIMFHDVNESLDKEYQEKGYSGFNDKTIHYDSLTGELLPKGKDVPNRENDILVINEAKTSLAKIRELVAQYDKVQGSKMYISAEKKEKAEPIIKELVEQNMNMTYKFILPDERYPELYECELYDGDKLLGEFTVSTELIGLIRPYLQEQEIK